MSFLDLEDDPFKRIQLELDQVEIRYTKLETVVKGATRLLGDCKAENIGKEIRKLKAEDPSLLKKQITHLKVKVIEQQDRIKAQESQIDRLKANWASLEKVRLITEYKGDLVAKARLFDEEVRKEGAMSQ